jgi:hypothetical protein
MLAIDVEAAKKIGLVLVAGLVLFAVISAIVIKKVTTKIISVVIMGGLALGVWTQRTAVKTCADKVQTAASTTGLPATTCKFFGTEVKIPQISVPQPTTTG